MNILISGAGIAGLTAAYWLHQAGHQCTVIEKAPDIRTEGYMIDFGGSGYDVANRMGLVPALQERQHHVPRINFMNPDGNVAAHIDIHKLYKVADVDGKFMVLNRRDIVIALYEHVQDFTRICFDMSIKNIEQSSDAITAEFSDGSTGSFDLLIGADGIHSQIRGMVFGEETDYATHLGYHFAILQIPAQGETLLGFDMYYEPGIQISVYPMEDDQLMIFITMQNDNPNPPPHAERAKVIRERLQGMGWICPKIASAITDDTYVFYDTITQIINPCWSQGRVVLIGDAAHCPTLVSGQGASMAMAGAYFLAQSLQNTTSIPDALRDYDAVLRPHINRIQTKAKNFAPNFVPGSQLRIAIVKFMIRLIDLPFIKQVVGKQFALKSVIPAQQ